MDVAQIAAIAETILEQQETGAVSAARPAPDVLLLRHRHPTGLEATLYEPVVCLILQGAKQTVLGERSVEFGQGECLLVSHDVPVVSRITRASPEQPYLAVIVNVDLALLRSLYEELDGLDLDPDEGSAFEAHAAAPGLLDAIGRRLAVAGDPLEERVLGPALRREIHFRLLRAPQGGMLRRLLRHDSHATRVARAIAEIRQQFRTRIAIPDLARSVGMSASSFHTHFKAITATTPLQYQKELRLLEARRLLTSEATTVSEVAYAVGYESPTQFSREYARKFGHPPSGERSAAETALAG